MAIDRGWKMNEYAVWSSPEETETVASRTEADVYAAFGLAWIPPELRENRGEIAAAANGTLPILIEQSDIAATCIATLPGPTAKAPCSKWPKPPRPSATTTSPSPTIPRLAMTRGLDPDRLQQQAEEIAAANDALPGFTILRGQEVDILKDGSLDQTDAALDQLDIVICSVHSHFDLSREAQTARMIRAISHPAVTIIGHPQGRLLERRDPIQLDLEAVFAAAIEHNVAMEINADPHRLDLHDTAIQLGKQKGVTFAINTDAHTPTGFPLLRYGIDEARRGWLSKEGDAEHEGVAGIVEGNRPIVRLFSGAECLSLLIARPFAAEKPDPGLISWVRAK